MEIMNIMYYLTWQISGMTTGSISVDITASQLTINHQDDVPEVDLSPGLDSGLAAIHSFICFSYSLDLQIIVL